MSSRTQKTKTPPLRNATFFRRRLRPITAEFMKELRAFLGFTTQAELAEALGVNHVTVYYWEQGSRSPNDTYRRALIRLLDQHEQKSKGKRQK